MYRQSVLLMIIALVCAAGVAFYMRGYLSTSNQAEAQKQAMVLAVIGELKAGMFIQPEKNVEWQPWPEESITAQHITPEKSKIEDYAGAVVRRAFAAGEPLVSASVVKSDEGGFLAAVLTPGRRAVSIAVNPTTGNAGLILPGDNVDLILTHQVRVENGESGDNVLASETFVSNVRILAVDQSFQQNGEEETTIPKTVTLEVSPKQAEMIQVASRLGEISLSLRSLGVTHRDGSEIESDLVKGLGNMTRDSDVSELLSGRSTNATPSRVQVFRGADAHQMEFMR
jgi:pilus assembly protein CpaB